MRNMSFSMTTSKMEDRTKDVTRRLGWWFLAQMYPELFPYPLMAVEKSQGLKKGEKVKPLYAIEVLSARAEPLCLLTGDIDYGYAELLREGFPNMHPWEFVQFFCDTHKCQRDVTVNRIEFREKVTNVTMAAIE